MLPGGSLDPPSLQSHRPGPGQMIQAVEQASQIKVPLTKGLNQLAPALSLAVRPIASHAHEMRQDSLKNFRWIALFMGR